MITPTDNNPLSQWMLKRDRGIYYNPSHLPVDVASHALEALSTLKYIIMSEDSEAIARYFEELTDEIKSKNALMRISGGIWGETD